MPIIILKDENGKPITDPLTGELVKAKVNKRTAEFLEKSDRNITALHDNDQRYFELVHFDTPAWENMWELSNKISAENECLDSQEEIAAAERTHYLRRRARYRSAYRLLRKSCTPTQWRRFVLHTVQGKSFREIAQQEKVNNKSVEESVRAAKIKIIKICDEMD